MPIFTLDYEIHGNGDGCPHALMVEPTARLLDLLEAFGAKLTIMADIAEIFRFKEHAEETGHDTFYAKNIERQLQDTIRRGHDVQLHIHSSYFGARLENSRWCQNWREYDFASLPSERMDWMIRRGKAFLDGLLQPIDPSYRCRVFRAANWSMSPSANVIKTLIDNGIGIDTSVFRYGRREGRVRFDYSAAASALVPWRVDANDICARDEDGRLWEFPIYSEHRSIAAFATLQRLVRALTGRFHRVTDSAPAPDAGDESRAGGWKSMWKSMLGPHAWKADFNQCTGRQLVAAIERARAEFGSADEARPFVLIGHSKLFSGYNARSLRPFLDHVRRHPDRFRFGTFRDFPLLADRFPGEAVEAAEKGKMLSA